ncbi:MAG TPA: FMN-binding protein [Nevskiaceae bacterium]|nr:FMN-binding protein [Nevskiaceae bacterium]
MPHHPGRSTSLSTSRRTLLRGGIALMVYGLLARAARAGESVWTTYQTPEAFIAETFGGAIPPVKTLELDAAVQAQVAGVFGHAYTQANKLRYWRANGRSAWILDDLGKQGYQLTTAGFVVKAGVVENAKVLIYRESRGEQVAEPSFLRQLIGAKLAGAQLDRNVDNISGATLSVQMMQRLARLALKLDAIAA